MHTAIRLWSEISKIVASLVPTRSTRSDDSKSPEVVQALGLKAGLSFRRRSPGGLIPLHCSDRFKIDGVRRQHYQGRYIAARGKDQFVNAAVLDQRKKTHFTRSLTSTLNLRAATTKLASLP